MIYEPLVMWNPVKPAEPGKPWLATEWKWADELTRRSTSPSATAPSWSDGQPLTADDVAYTFKLLKDNEALNTNAIPYGDITASGNKVDRDVHQVRSSSTRTSSSARRSIVPEAHLVDARATRATDTRQEPGRHRPVHAEVVHPADHHADRARRGYWQDLPQVKELRYTSYNDNNAQTTALANGASEWSFVFIPNYKAVFIDKDPAHHKLWSPPVLGIHGLYINTTKKPFDDPALRRAMNMVINREDIFKQGEAGYFHPQVDERDRHPDAGRRRVHRAGVQGQEPRGRRRGRQEGAHRRRLQARRRHPEGPDRQAGELTLTDPAGWSDYHHRPGDHQGQPVHRSASRPPSTRPTRTPGSRTSTRATSTPRCTGPTAAPRRTTSTRTSWTARCSSRSARPAPAATSAASTTRRRPRRWRTTPTPTDDADPHRGDEHAAEDLRRAGADDPGLGADNVGGAYSTKNWIGWPDDANPYAPAQPTQPNALDVVLHLKPAGA